MKHMISFSGGKDSTAMLLRMFELGMQIDDIVFFDTGWEFAEMHKHISQVEEYLARRIHRIEPQKSFDYWMFEHEFTKGKRVGLQKGYGFPSAYRRWCTREKINSLDKILKGNVVYIGYAIDEYQRQFKKTLAKKHYTIKFPLIEWGWSEKDCLEYCYSKGFDWGGLYSYFRRVSCWCCPLQGLNELRNLRRCFPDLWANLLDMQTRSWNSFRTDGTTVFGLDKRFEQEERQLDLKI